MDSFHRHLDELERLLSDNDKKKRRMKSRALSFAASVGSNPVVETLIHKGVGKEYKQIPYNGKSYEIYRKSGNFHVNQFA